MIHRPSGDHNRLLAPFSFYASRHKHTIHTVFLIPLKSSVLLFYCKPDLFPALFPCAGERIVQGHQQDLPPADLPPDAPLQVDQTECAQEEVPGLVSVSAPPLPMAADDGVARASVTEISGERWLDLQHMVQVTQFSFKKARKKWAEKKKKSSRKVATFSDQNQAAGSALI